jgi:hypothetical protein
MQQQRDVLMVCLFDRNEPLMHALTAEAAPRVASMGTRATRDSVRQLLHSSSLSTDDCTVVFLTMLSRDAELKKKTIEGIPKHHLCGMHREKAANFFLYLDRDVLLPWIRDEFFSNAAMLAKCRDMYLMA